jgi:hypothetical protein
MKNEVFPPSVYIYKWSYLFSYFRSLERCLGGEPNLT